MLNTSLPQAPSDNLFSTMDPAPPPVAPPQTSPYPRQTGDGPTCPQCNSDNTKEVKYTWWGGLLGPKMMNLQKCEGCGFQFNRVTRQSVKNAIVMYNLVALVAAILIFFVVFKGLF
jgi:hypothetical protein